MVRASPVSRLGHTEMQLLDVTASLHFLPDAAPGFDNVAQVAEKIRGRAEEPIRHSGVTIHATLNIGATLAAPGESESTLRARVEAAMEAAKLDGGNKCRSVPAPA